MSAELDTSLMFYYSLIMFVCFWCFVLHMKEGARAVESTLRLNFWHGVISSYLVIHAFIKPRGYPEEFVVACSLAYFLVDLNNMVMNDFVYKVGGYQKKSARALEYFHHILSIQATFACATALDVVCDLGSEHMQFQGPFNPLIRFAVADFSTPALVMWRRSDQKSLLWYSIFAILFISVRVVYHGIYFVPRLYQGCNEIVKVGVTFYQVLQLVMLAFVGLKWKSMIVKAFKGKGAADADAAKNDTLEETAAETKAEANAKKTK